MVNTPVVGNQRVYYNPGYNNQGRVFQNHNNQVQSQVPSSQPDTFVSPSYLKTDAVYTTWKNPNSAPISQDDAALTIVHLNDNHRKVKGLTKFKTAFQEIEAKVRQAGVGLVKVHSGDYNVGTDEKKLQLQVEMLNDLGIDYAAVGNHELDYGPKALAKALKQANFISVSSNLITPTGSGLDELKQTGKLVNLATFERNGHTYGVVGLAPPDLIKRLDPNQNLYGVNVLDEAQTIQNVQEEVDKLKARGINKILLVSHVGLDIDQKIARQTDGIDIILGGHSHDLVNPMEPGVSLLYSKSNEPVLIFQNGKNAKYFGVTDARFDQNGIVKATIARQEKADSFDIDHQIRTLEDKLLGPSPVIGVSAGTYTSDGVKLKENAIANFIADAVRKKTGAQIALFQSFAVRDTVDKGDIRERDIDEVLPFIDAVHILKITGQDVIEALNNGSKTVVSKNGRPGILQVSGLKYTISPEGKAVNVMVEQQDGSYVPLNPAQEYTVAYDQYLIKGAEGFSSLAKPMNVFKALYDDNAMIVKENIKARNMQPVEMKTEGRITINAQGPVKDVPKALQKAEVPYYKTAGNQQSQQPTNHHGHPQNTVPQLVPNVAYRMPPQPIPFPVPGGTPPYYYPSAPVPMNYGYYPQYNQNPFYNYMSAAPFSQTR
jgi:2',3'-cyclic-nucleotide 2'-phosphodiesterase (5'-nucleotidase family)